MPYSMVFTCMVFLGAAVGPNILKFAGIIVALLCIIAIVVWLSGILGGGPGLPHFWVYYSWTSRIMPPPP